MTKSHDTLYGNVPDKSPVVLLLIDVINDLDVSDSDKLLRLTLPMAKRLASLRERAKQYGCAVIYVNDNFGRWRSDFKSQVQHCLRLSNSSNLASKKGCLSRTPRIQHSPHSEWLPEATSYVTTRSNF
jgi:hypothetical protein